MRGGISIFLLTEQALRLRVAPTSVLIEQLRHAIELAERPNIELTVLPVSALLGDVPMNIFAVYDERLVMVEFFSGGVALRDPQDIFYHLNIFEYFNNRALSGVAAQRFVESIAGEFMRARD